MLKNVDQCFPKPKTTSSNLLFCPQPKDNQFTVIEEKETRKYSLLRSWNQRIYLFFLKKKVVKLINGIVGSVIKYADSSSKLHSKTSKEALNVKNQYSPTIYI